MQKSLVDFSDFEDGEQEEQEIVPEEPEIRISREELIARYQVRSWQPFHIFVFHSSSSSSSGS